MTPAVGFGALCGLGLVLAVAGVRGVEPSVLFDDVGSSSSSFVVQLLDRLEERFDQLRLRAGLGAGVALTMLWLTGWPVGIILGAVGGFTSPTLIAAKQRRDAAVAKTEAIARWTEQLRDTIQSAAGLQEAIVVTAPVAPKPIRADVKELAASIRHRGIEPALARFAESVDDPVADQVVVALTLSARRGGEKLSTMLNGLAAAANEQAEMRLRVETSRAQTFSDARAVTMIVVGVFVIMLLTNRRYVEPYNSLTGQIVLTVVGALWLGALYLIVDLAKVDPGTRLLGEDEPAAL